MLYSETIAVCSQIHTKHINKLCEQNVELLNVKLLVLQTMHREPPAAISWQHWILLCCWQPFKWTIPKKRVSFSWQQLLGKCALILPYFTLQIL